MWLIIVFVFLATVYSWVPQDVLKKEKKKPWPEPLHGFVSFPWNLYTSSGKQETGEVIYWTTETCTEIESIKQNKKFVYNSNKLEKKKKKKKNINLWYDKVKLLSKIIDRAWAGDWLLLVRITPISLPSLLSVSLYVHLIPKKI